MVTLRRYIILSHLERVECLALTKKSADWNVWKLPNENNRQRLDNELLSHMEKITNTIKKVTFCGHLQIMKFDRLTRKLFGYL